MMFNATSVPGARGSVVYLLGLSPIEETLRQLGQEITARVAGVAQVTYLDSTSVDGIRVAEFYDINIESLPAVLIVRADGALYQSWTGSNMPAADVVAHHIGQITR